MPAFSRREFGQIVIAGVPLAATLTPSRLRASGPLALGVSTASFRDLPRVTGRDNIDDVLRAVRTVRAMHVELALANVEPAPPSTAPVMGGSPAYPRRIVLTPEQVAATNIGARTALRTWRREAPPAFFAEVRGKLAEAGIIVHACALSYDESFTDEEIDATFRQVKALGVATISSTMTLSTAARLAPFAERHKMAVAVRNQMDGNAEGLVGHADFDKVLELSPAFKITLDVGNLTASNRDAVADVQRYQARLSHVIVRDRLRNGGSSQPFGEGDTPIAGVLAVLGTSAASVPALIDYDYSGLRSSVEEVASALTYLTTALDSRR